MKIVPPKSGQTQRAEPVLSLSSLPLAHSKSNSAGFELLSDPTDANSVKYRMTILRIQGGEDTRTLLQWWTDVHKVLEGLALGSPAAKCKIVATIIQGAPQASLNSKKKPSLTTFARILSLEYISIPLSKRWNAYCKRTHGTGLSYEEGQRYRVVSDD